MEEARKKLNGLIFTYGPGTVLEMLADECEELAESPFAWTEERKLHITKSLVRIKDVITEK